MAGATQNGFSFFPDAIRGAQGVRGPEGPQGVPGPTGPAGPATTLSGLTDVNDALLTAEDGTSIVRNSGEWVRNGYLRLALGYTTDVTIDGDQTIALGFTETGDSHKFGSSSSSSIAIGKSASRYVQGVFVTLSSSINASVTVIIVSDASGFIAGQTIKIGTELITIGTINGNTFDGCTRGVAPSVAASHSSGDRVLAIHPEAVPPYDLSLYSTYIVLNNSNSIAIGTSSAEFEHAQDVIAIGRSAGRYYQGDYGLSIGTFAGENGQLYRSIAIGYAAGRYAQQTYSIAIGYTAGETTQDDFSIAIGYGAGKTTQANYATAVGFQAGQTTQGASATALGYRAGSASQGASSVAVGANAGRVTCHANAIIINGSGSDVASTGTSRCHIRPIRSAGVGTGTTIGPPAGHQMLCYNTTTYEVCYFTQA